MNDWWILWYIPSTNQFMIFSCYRSVNFVLFYPTVTESVIFRICLRNRNSQGIFHSTAGRIFKFFSPNRSTNFTIFSWDRMIKFTFFFLPQVSEKFSNFFLQSDYQIPCEWQILLFTSWHLWQNSRCFSQAKRKIFVLFFCDR